MSQLEDDRGSNNVGDMLPAVREEISQDIAMLRATHEAYIQALVEKGNAIIADDPEVRMPENSDDAVAVKKDAYRSLKTVLFQCTEQVSWGVFII